MRVAIKISLAVILSAAIGLIAFLLSTWPAQKETWATITALLAVVVAVVSVWPAIRVIEIQEDLSAPNPVPFFDSASRHQLLQLRVKNFGGGVAYDVVVKWDKHPKDEDGKDLIALDSIPSLVPQASVSTLVGRPWILLKKYPTMTFSGSIICKDAGGKRRTNKFSVTADADRNRLIHDEELPKTLFELQKLPESLNDIAKAIRSMPELSKQSTSSH